MRFDIPKKIFALIFLALTCQAALADELLVSAASSLSNAFKEIGQAYEGKYPKSKVAFNFAASGALVQQIAKGAPVDVFASADQETMDLAEKQGLVAAKTRHDFARNRLVLIVPVKSKLTIKNLSDLAQQGVTRVAIGNPASVPVGRYSKHALDAAKMWAGIESKMIRTQNVRQALDYVARNEVDAGFVYASDAALMPGKVQIAFVVPLVMAIKYPLAQTSNSSNPVAATRFNDFVRSNTGQAILAKFGFQQP